MKIAAGQVHYLSSHSLEQEKIHKERLNVWFGDPPVPDREPGNRTDRLIASDRIVLSGNFSRDLEPADSGDRPASPGEDTRLDPRLQAMKTILEMLTGRRIRISGFTPGEEGASASLPARPQGGQRAPASAGWGLAYDYVETYRESEELQVKARGMVNTADGRKIGFDLGLTMSREFQRSTELHLRLGDARLIDPLILNFDGKGAELTDSTFLFDLDLDGEREEIAGPAQGSGFLALDRNGDGVINDGSELFGPRTGHGFSELARFDQDGNGWLDENDPIWDRLAAWMRDAAGNNRLVRLTDTGVGALHLEPVAGEFSLNNSRHETLGLIREHGVFIRENGQAGFMQEIDLKA